MRAGVVTASESALGNFPAELLPRDLTETIRFAEIVSFQIPPIPQLEVSRRGLERLAGYNPLIPWRFALYAAAAGGFDLSGQRFDITIPLPRIAEPALFDLLGVTYRLLSVPDWHWERSPSAFPRAYLVSRPIVVPEEEGFSLAREREALARLVRINPRSSVLLHGAAAEQALAPLRSTGADAFEPYRSVAVASRTAHRLKLDVTLTRPGILVLNEPFFPGWRAHDGEREVPVLRANVLFRALALTPGEHHLELEFAPESWRVGGWISASALATTLALVAAALARTRSLSFASLKKGGG